MTESLSIPAPHASPGRVPVILYIAGDNPVANGEALFLARRFASDREWTVVAEQTDTSTTAPLPDRAGWETVTAALADGTAHGVVVGALDMVADSPAEFAALGVLVRDRGAFLVEAAGVPRRTPGQYSRRRNLHDAATYGPKAR